MKKILYTILALALVCSCELLDRPTLTKVVDNGFWRSEADFRLFANGFYPSYFEGYGVGWDQAYAPVRGGTGFSDDFVTEGKQSAFSNKVPSSSGSSSESRSCSSEWYGPSWGFGRVRKANIFIDRVKEYGKENLTEEEYNHWLAVAYFFKAYEYYDLVNVYGNVPYFETTVRDDDPDTMYKDRDNRQYVMDKVYDMCRFVLDNMRTDDGANTLNRYIAAGFISRMMLNEGTWQYYHAQQYEEFCDNEHAKKYLQMAVEAGDLVIKSGKYSFDSDFKSLFASGDLAGNPEVLMYRHYDAGLSITHCVGSYTGGSESQTGVNLEFIKAFNCNDGQPMLLSKAADPNDPSELSLAKLAVSRDPRFFDTFYNRVSKHSSSMIYSTKFAAREALDYYFANNQKHPDWNGMYNTNDAPIMRLGEVALNWIEAKAVLAEMGVGNVTQEDIDASINGIRNRPLNADAVAAGVKKTTALSLSAIPDDPMRDGDVSPLMWEIRRERRMELFHEGNRIKDLRRWYKLDYMDYDTNPDKYLGPWIDFPVEEPQFMKDKINVLKVQDAEGNIHTYNGTNPSDMVGFYCVRNAVNRETFFIRSYMRPVGEQQINDYKMRGYKLTQTVNW